MTTTQRTPAGLVRIRIRHECDGEFPGDGNYDVEKPDVPTVGDYVELPQRFYRHPVRVTSRHWFYNESTPADVVLIVES